MPQPADLRIMLCVWAVWRQQRIRACVLECARGGTGAGAGTGRCSHACRGGGGGGRGVLVSHRTCSFCRQASFSGLASSSRVQVSMLAVVSCPAPRKVST
eukprot:COSAG01_NODE_1072_length_11863_cov_13.614587_3_plen_100_part_00